MTDMVTVAKEHFYQWLEEHKDGPFDYLTHVPRVEHWARTMLARHPGIDEEIVLAAVWLHDIGSYPLVQGKDHAVEGEKAARALLEKHAYPAERVAAVLHCIRAHRCKDVMPATLEAKLVACCDSASHLTDYIYAKLAFDGPDGMAKASRKIENDYKDLAFFPDLQERLTPLYQKWKGLLEEIRKDI
jgi:HD superfamily phosphodiesterase